MIYNVKEKIFDWVFLICVIIAIITGQLFDNNHISGVVQGLLLAIGIFDLIIDYKEK